MTYNMGDIEDTSFNVGERVVITNVTAFDKLIGVKIGDTGKVSKHIGGFLYSIKLDNPPTKDHRFVPMSCVQITSCKNIKVDVGDLI